MKLELYAKKAGENYALAAEFEDRELFEKSMNAILQKRVRFEVDDDVDKVIRLFLQGKAIPGAQRRKLTGALCHVREVYLADELIETIEGLKGYDSIKLYNGDDTPTVDLSDYEW